MILEMVSNDDIMFQYEGVQQLCQALNFVQDQGSMSRSMVEGFCNKLVGLVQAPVIMGEISNEIKSKLQYSTDDLCFLFSDGYLEPLFADRHLSAAGDSDLQTGHRHGTEAGDERMHGALSDRVVHQALR